MGSELSALVFRENEVNALEAGARNQWDVCRAITRPIIGTAKSHPRTQMSLACEPRCQVSLSFFACCKSCCMCVASGTRPAKEVGFDCVHPFQPFPELRLYERESVATRSLPPRRGTLMDPLFYV